MFAIKNTEKYELYLYFLQKHRFDRTQIKVYNIKNSKQHFETLSGILIVTTITLKV